MSNPFSLENKVILITGASSGIGKQCAISCSQMGATVILVARDTERLEQTLSQMIPGNHLYYTQDVTKFDELENFVIDAVRKSGKISGFIHAAGIGLTLPLQVHKYETYLSQLEVNTLAALELTRILSKRKYYSPKNASFVIVSSIMGILGQAGKVGYCASKGAVTSAVKALAVELAPKKIRINAVLPGQVNDTPMTEAMVKQLPSEAIAENQRMHPLGWVSSESVANACVFLLSNAADYITGINLVVDGGYSAK